MKVRLKVCCISSIEEMRLAVQYGASALGLVGDMPSGPGIITLDLAREICELTPPGLSTFLLTSASDKRKIVEELRYTKVNVVQLVDAVSEETYDYIREHTSNVKIVQVIHVLTESDIQLASRLATYVDALLLDSGNPNATIKELGGTGRIHNWEISRDIVQSVNKPVFLAGGINPENVHQAIGIVNPYGIDLCSGVRTDHVLDKSKLLKLCQAMS